MFYFWFWQGYLRWLTKFWRMKHSHFLPFPRMIILTRVHLLQKRSNYEFGPRGYVGCLQILISAVHENVPWKAKCFTASVPITISWVHLQIMNDVWPILNPHWSFGVCTNTHQNIRLDRSCAQVVAKAYRLHAKKRLIVVIFFSRNRNFSHL